MNVSSWSDQLIERFGEFDALVSAGRTWTSVEVHEQAARCAAALVAGGIAPGDRLLLWLPNDLELVVAFTGALRAGAVAIVIGESVPFDEVARVTSLCSAALVVTTARNATGPGSQLARLPRTVVVAAGEAGASAHEPSFASWLACHPPLAEPVPRGPDDAAQIVFTSGTIANPKALVWTHGVIAARYGAHVDRRRSSAPALSAACPLPLSAAFGSQFFYFRLLQKMRLTLLDGFDPERFLAAVERERIEMTWLVPTMCEALLQVADRVPYDSSSLSTVYVGGARVSSSLVTRFRRRFKVAITTVYGLTELGHVAASLPGRGGSMSVPRSSARIRIVDESQQEVPSGNVGRIHVRADGMRARYYQPAGEADPVPDGWFETGDLGLIDAEGNLHVVGRHNELIIQGGINIYPDQISEIVLGLTGVRDCAVIGVPDAFLGEEAVVCVVRDQAAELSARDVLARCRTSLEPRRRPTRVCFVDAIPRNALGKLKRDTLREQILEERNRTVDTDLMRRLRQAGPRERLHLLRLEVLSQVAAVLPDASTSVAEGRTQSFGELGVESIGAVQFARALGDALGRTLPATLTFSYPTIDTLCQHLATELFDGVPTTSRRSAALAGRRPVHEDIALIGIGCRLPRGVATPDEFWSLLRDGVDATQEINRWDIDRLYDARRGVSGKTYTRRAALLDNPEAFDAGFFGLTPREAAEIGAHHRLVLEVAWEALEDAGYNPLSFAGGSVGVFLGMNGASESRATVPSAPGMAVGRICHFLDLRGPAAVVDTTCSSSLFGLHLAVQSLRLGECDAALAGGVHVIGSPRSFVGLSQMGLVAADGRCKAFDASADGYGRGEGCVIVALKRASDAQADGDRIVAIVRGSAARHDGRSSSLTAPNGQAQQTVIRAALEDAGASPSEIDYLEAHGAGTALGDPIEIEAASSVYGDPSRPLIVASVKSNVAHLETAAGVTALVKVALSLEHGQIPAHLHCRTLNPLLRPFADRFLIPQTLQTWPRLLGRPRMAAVSSMGLSGTNVHVVVQEAPPPRSLPGQDAVPAGAAPESEPHLICVSARSASGLAAQAERYAAHLAQVADATFADWCFTANSGRAHFTERLAVVAHAPNEARARLLDQPRASHRSGLARGQSPRAKVAFLFSGQGTQYVGMGRRLYQSERVFRDALNHCDEITRPWLPRPLVKALYPESGDLAGAAGLDDIVLAQPASFAFQWALFELWKSWGIEPDVVLGHSVGECAAACVAGLLTLEDGLTLAAARGRLMQSLTTPGAMVAMRMSADDVRATLGADSDGVAIAACNGPASTVISGPESSVVRVADRLAASGIDVRRLAISRASHSPLMEPILDALETIAAQLNYERLRIPLVSTVTGERATSEELAQPQHWRRHMREPVQFAKGMASLLAEECEVFVEVGPQPALVNMGQDCARGHSQPCGWLPSLRRDRDDREQLLETLGELYTYGIDPSWNGVYRDAGRRRVSIPTYAFERSQTAASAPVFGSARATPPVDVAGVVNVVRHHVAAVVDRKPESLPADASILSLGVDSLRLLDLAASLRRALGIPCTPMDVIECADLTGLAERLLARLAPISNPEQAVEPRAPIETPPAASVSRSLVCLNGRGHRVPVICVHPSGGQVTAYLRFRQLLGEDQPLYAIQSRALHDAAAEHASIEAMARDYASVVQGIQPGGGPYRLVGWSMGGLVALAVAAELEQRGQTVATVGLIDPVLVPNPDSGAAVDDDAAIALTAVMYETSGRPSRRATAALRHAPRFDEIPSGELLAWCEREHVIPRGALTAPAFETAMRLYLIHFQLVRAYRPQTVRSPLTIWRAGERRSPYQWSQHTLGGATEKYFGATHFSIVRSPHVEMIATDLAATSLAGGVA